MQIKADLHVHTIYSNDSVITPKALVYYAKKRGLNAVAVTDHNKIEGALNIAKKSDILIIPGIEVSSLKGHVVGLNINEGIPKSLSVEETVDRIHEAGGIAVACHPFALFKGSIGNNISTNFDAIETINASSFPFGRTTRKANKLADKLKLPKVAGTDAHYPPVIGQAYTIIESEAKVDDIIKAIQRGQCEPVGSSISMLMRLENQGRFFWKYFRGENRFL